MRLERWAVVFTPISPYQAPEQAGVKLSGIVYGHPTLPDGINITTSRIVSVDAAAGTVTTKSGNVYELGQVEANYEVLFPDARKRLFKENQNAKQS